jgi:hypothetical protein
VASESLDTEEAWFFAILNTIALNSALVLYVSGKANSIAIRNSHVP